jgi:hypothetical protein
MSIYRKIYEQNNGLIPVDEQGVTYDIHHIDGNRKNNDPKNLIAVSIQEHYDIHYKQKDWDACKLIAARLKMSVEDRKELYRKSIRKMVENGTHNFLGGEIQRKRVENGTHNLLSGEIQRKCQKRLISTGKHNFQKVNANTVRLTCPKCGKVAGAPNYSRWGHGENCERK